MLGLVRWSAERKVSLERTRVLGLLVLCVRVPSGGRWEKCRVGRAARLLERQGVRRVLVPRNFVQWDVLAGRGLTGVDVLPLYRTMADRLTLAVLARRGVESRRACVELRGDYVDADMAQAARLLCPRVRSLNIRVDWGGERLARELYWEFGAAPRPEGEADVAVRFDGVGQEGELVLCGSAPELLGLEPKVPGLELPGELEPLPLLTALWQAGRLNLEQMQVSAK